MSLNKGNIPLSAKQISIMDKNGKFDYNHIVQRGLVWERSRKTGLIESMILGYPIPQIYCRRDRDETQPKKKGDSTYVIMDGKQRLTTIASFLQNEWKLSEMNPVTYTCYAQSEETEDLSGRSFSELPEEIQDTLKDTIINFVYFDSITLEEERELFKRLNAGKPLSTKARVIASCADLTNILEIGDHSVFREMMTENALSQKNHVTVIMKMWAMLNLPNDSISFESKFFNPFVESVKMDWEQRLALQNVFDFVKSCHNVLIERGQKKLAKKLYTETHLVSLVPFIVRAFDDMYDEEQFCDWIEHFFDAEDEKEVSEYYNACLAGSAKTENIIARSRALESSYNSFFKGV